MRTRFGAEPAEVHIFVMTLGYSRRAWVEGYENERLGALLAAHEHAFAHFGGVTREILYDRMRTVTLGSAEGKPRWSPTFEAFARHWGFEPRLCRPYRAQTKGKVESGVKYVKRNFLLGRVFRDLEDFNAQLTGRHQLQVCPEHGPGAAARNARKRLSDAPPVPRTDPRVHQLHGVEVRDLALYDALLEVA